MRYTRRLSLRNFSRQTPQDVEHTTNVYSVINVAAHEHEMMFLLR
jgi:hypothetical protein